MNAVWWRLQSSPAETKSGGQGPPPSEKPAGVRSLLLLGRSLKPFLPALQVCRTTLPLDLLVELLAHGKV